MPEYVFFADTIKQKLKNNDLFTYVLKMHFPLLLFHLNILIENISTISKRRMVK